MIKALEFVKKHQLHETIMKRFNNYPGLQDLCRFTMAELKELGRREHSTYMSTNPEVHMHFLNSLTRFEENCIYVLQRTNRKDKIDQLERRVKTATQKTTRLLEDLTSVIEKEQELQPAIDDLQTERTRIGSPSV